MSMRETFSTMWGMLLWRVGLVRLKDYADYAAGVPEMVYQHNKPIPDNDKILSDHLPTAIEEYLRVCGVDLKYNAFHLLSESKERIAELEAENDKFRQFIDTRIPDQGSQIKRLKADNDRLRGALQFIDDEAHDLNAAEECARQALKGKDDE